MLTSATQKIRQFLAVPWRRSVAWLLLLGPFFFLSYGYANHQAAASGVNTSLFFAWERQIPFWAWTIIPYWSIDLFYGLSFLCCRNSLEVDRHAGRLLTAQLLSVSGFLFWPLHFAFERPAADGLFGAMFNALAGFDQPYNQAPSLHISLLLLIWQRFATCANERRWPAPVKGLLHAWALLIGVSVLTTWQHHFIDLPTGAAVGLFCLWLWPDDQFACPWQRNRQGERQARRRLVIRYLAGAAVALALMLVIGHFWPALPGAENGFGSHGWAALALLGIGLLGWLMLALLLVAFNYAWAGAPGFQKLAGRHTLAAQGLLAPYFLGARLNARWWSARHPQADHIADEVWLGHLPSASEMRLGGYNGLCDLTAELAAPTGPWRYAGLPWLDLVPPDHEQLLAAAKTIAEMRIQCRGRIRVACALGYSRSAMAVIAWLRYSGQAASLSIAVARVRAQRPGVVLSAAHMEALATFEQHLAQSQ